MQQEREPLIKTLDMFSLPLFKKLDMFNPQLIKLLKLSRINLLSLPISIPQSILEYLQGMMSTRPQFKKCKDLSIENYITLKKIKEELQFLMQILKKRKLVAVLAVGLYGVSWVLLL